MAGRYSNHGGNGQSRIGSSSGNHVPFSDPIFRTDPTGGRYDTLNPDGSVHKYDPQRDCNPQYNALLTQQNMQRILMQKIALEEQFDKTQALAEQLAAIRHAKEEKREAKAQRDAESYAYHHGIALPENHGRVRFIDTPYGSGHYIENGNGESRDTATLDRLASMRRTDTDEVAHTTTTPTSTSVASAMHSGTFTDKEGKVHHAVFMPNENGDWQIMVKPNEVALLDKTIKVTLDKGDSKAGQTFEVDLKPNMEVAAVHQIPGIVDQNMGKKMC